MASTAMTASKRLAFVSWVSQLTRLHVLAAAFLRYARSVGEFGVE